MALALRSLRGGGGVLHLHGGVLQQPETVRAPVRQDVDRAKQGAQGEPVSGPAGPGGGQGCPGAEERGAAEDHGGDDGGGGVWLAIGLPPSLLPGVHAHVYHGATVSGAVLAVGLRVVRDCQVQGVIHRSEISYLLFLLRLRRLRGGGATRNFSEKSRTAIFGGEGERDTSLLFRKLRGSGGIRTRSVAREIIYPDRNISYASYRHADPK